VSWLDALYLAGYPALIAGAAILVSPRRRLAQARSLLDAIALVAREKPLVLGVDASDVDEAQLLALCRKANLHPQQWLCLCTATRVREGAAAVLKGATTLEAVALMTGTRSGCTIYCLQPTLRLLKAHGVKVVAPEEGYRWYDTSQTCWDVPEEVKKRYPGHFLEEDLQVFRKF
jgi:bacterioferritin-associated ferredoxin